MEEENDDGEEEDKEEPEVDDGDESDAEEIAPAESEKANGKMKTVASALMGSGSKRAPPAKKKVKVRYPP